LPAFFESGEDRSADCVTSSPFSAFIRSLWPDTLQIIHTPKIEQVLTAPNLLKYKHIYLLNPGVADYYLDENRLAD
jgi:hypothetical protein